MDRGGILSGLQLVSLISGLSIVRYQKKKKNLINCVGSIKTLLRLPELVLMNMVLVGVMSNKLIVECMTHDVLLELHM